MRQRTPLEWDQWVEEFSRGDHSEAWRGIMCFMRWIQLREENGHPVPAFLLGIEGDLYHSKLLPRLLSGKEPLPHPPPESFGQGWYELIESGTGIASEVRLWEWAPEQKISVNQDIWTIVEKRSDEDFLVTYRPGGEIFHLRRDSDQHWLLERISMNQYEPCGESTKS